MHGKQGILFATANMWLLHVLWFSKDSLLHTETLACKYSDTTKDKLLLHLLHTH